MPKPSSVRIKIACTAAALGRPISIDASLRDLNASSSASVKLDVATVSRCGWSAVLRSSAASTASVALCTSAGFAESDAALRATLIDSTSSRITTVGMPSSARRGM